MKAAVIGVGAMGGNHARIYSEMPGVQLTGIADADPEITRQASAKYGVPGYVNYHELLARPLDAVSIVVPTSLHREVAIAAARAGVNALVEKPVASTIPAAREIIEEFNKAGVNLMVGHVERFNPVVSVVKKIIENEVVCLLEITRIGPFPPRIKDVGIIIDLATHDVDLLRFLTGSEFKKSFGLISRNLIEHEDAAILGFEMEDGTLARVSTNWLTPFKVREMTIATRTKYIKASLTEQKVTEYGRYADNESYVVNEIRVPYGEPLKLELEAFIDSIERGTPPPVTGNDGLKVLEVLGKCGIDLWNECPDSSLVSEAVGIQL